MTVFVQNTTVNVCTNCCPCDCPQPPTDNCDNKCVNCGGQCPGFISQPCCDNLIPAQLILTLSDCGGPAPDCASFDHTDVLTFYGPDVPLDGLFFDNGSWRGTNTDFNWLLYCEDGVWHIGCNCGDIGDHLLTCNFGATDEDSVSDFTCDPFFFQKQDTWGACQLVFCVCTLTISAPTSGSVLDCNYNTGGTWSIDISGFTGTGSLDCGVTLPSAVELSFDVSCTWTATYGDCIFSLKRIGTDWQFTWNYSSTDIAVYTVSNTCGTSLVLDESSTNGTYLASWPDTITATYTSGSFDCFSCECCGKCTCCGICKYNTQDVFHLAFSGWSGATVFNDDWELAWAGACKWSQTKNGATVELRLAASSIGEFHIWELSCYIGSAEAVRYLDVGPVDPCGYGEPVTEPAGHRTASFGFSFPNYFIDDITAPFGPTVYFYGATNTTVTVDCSECQCCSDIECQVPETIDGIVCVRFSNGDVLSDALLSAPITMTQQADEEETGCHLWYGKTTVCTNVGSGVIAAKLRCCNTFGDYVTHPVEGTIVASMGYIPPSMFTSGGYVWWNITGLDAAGFESSCQGFDLDDDTAQDQAFTCTGEFPRSYGWLPIFKSLADVYGCPAVGPIPIGFENPASTPFTIGMTCDPFQGSVGSGGTIDEWSSQPLTDFCGGSPPDGYRDMGAFIRFPDAATFPMAMWKSNFKAQAIQRLKQRLKIIRY